MKKVFALIPIICVLVLTACGSDDTSNGDKGTLTMYTPMPEENAEAYVKKFEEDTGIKVNYTRLSTGEILAKLKSEKGRSDASIWFAGPSDSFIEADEEGLLEKYDPENLENLDKIDENAMVEDASWLPIYQGPIAFASNENWLEENNVEAPTSWEDLLKPEFKNNIMLAHPGASGTGYQFISTLVQVMGEDEAFDYLKAFNKNVKQWTKGGSANAQFIGQGEVGTGLAFAQDLLPLKEEGYPIKITYPEDGVSVAVEGAAKIKGGPEKEKENAKEFMHWINSEEGQNVYADTGYYHLPVIPDAKIPEGAPYLSKFNVADTDNVWASEHRDELVDKFEREVQSEDEASDK
ncbi:ABC transporter substrate-binding protein [Lentibacillus daqui]|uniref:ABC transporter substrate-binding protein n=1 Tax=Lentibacillus daqui TaxID=2911514 RepID=UPI0022B2126F|nr:ABC transporter substrate-binding protein [Lentibacillus daqui]